MIPIRDIFATNGASATVKPNIVWATDLITPSPEATKGPGSRALGLALERYGIKDATIASGNGGSAKQSDLAGVLSE